MSVTQNKNKQAMHKPTAAHGDCQAGQDTAIKEAAEALRGVSSAAQSCTLLVARLAAEIII